MSEWKPIETAPKDGTLIIVFRPRGNEHIPHVSCDYWRKFESGPSWALSNRYYPPTYWQPLPDPPKEAP